MPDLTTLAPSGAHFDFEEVKTAKGAESLGEVPILVWDSLPAATEHYGGEVAICDVLDGTSLRVSFQGIARRMKLVKKSDDEIATAQISFKPGKRAGGASTPVSRASKAAKAATEKLGAQGDMVEALLAKIASGSLTADDIAALTGVGQ